MSSMSPQPRSAASIYGGIVAAVTTIAVSIILFRRLRETGNKSRDKDISKQGASQPPSIDQEGGDEQKFHVSALAQSTTPFPQPVEYSARDEGLGISVPSHAPPTTSEPQFINQDAIDEHNLNNTSAVPVDHSAGDEGHLGISVPLQVPQCIDQDLKDKNISIPAQGSTTYGDIGGEELPSIALSQGSSNFAISETNATIIRNGDGQFTRIQRNLAYGYITDSVMLPNINYNKKHVLAPSIINLPRAEAMFHDYQSKKNAPCFKSTIVALLREMADCVTGSSECRMYVLSGLAGMGKSTVAHTIASRAAYLNLLGASFCFSRDETDCNNAKRFFTTIAYQLCVYNETFAKAIGDVLETEHGSAATTKDPQNQLQSLILDPLRSIVQSRSRPILIVVDALDECDEEDAISVLTGLRHLVQVLPSFKVILTTRPHPYFDHFLSSQGGHRFFHLQDTENNVVDDDIRVYLNHRLSLDQVQMRFPKRQWCASDEEIDSLVRTAGRSFIIASTAVRYILDKSASNPAAQMQKLLHIFAQNHTAFKDLDHFYTVILQNIVPENCDDNDDIVSRYRSVIGTFIFIQRPLPVSTLSRLIDINVEEIHEVLDKLQSVILLGGDGVPRVYHNSFPDYLTDQARCKNPHLRIDPRICHTQIATQCFEIMDKHLKYNILGLGDPARFMNNEDGLKEDGITEEKLEEKIPQQLRYACICWANHLEAANTEDADLMNGLERFLTKHVLHWFEVLSLIGQLDSAQLAILKLLKSTSLDLPPLLSDASRFISKFYGIIERSALHTYYSALPFTPTNGLLYRQYIKETAHNICSIEGGPEKWDALVANLSHGHGQSVTAIKFSLDSALFVSFMERGMEDNVLKIWDAATGTPISTISGDKFAVSNDFSTVASSWDNITTLYSVNRGPSGTVFTASSKVQKLSLSSESRRVAAALADGTVSLWDSANAKLIDSFDGFGSRGWLKFSATGTRLAYSSANGIKLRDGISGRFIADLRCESKHKFEFSGDGSRIASLSSCLSPSWYYLNNYFDIDNPLTLWNSESGGLVDAVSDFSEISHTDVGFDVYALAISANGSLFATANVDKITLWSGNNDSLAKIKVLKDDFTQLMAFSLDILAIATNSDITLYNVNTHSYISTLLFGGFSSALGFSPDCTHLAVGDHGGNVSLCDIRGIDASCPPSKEASAIVTLALSRDCSRLACGFRDGTVELWGTTPTKRRIASHQAHERSVQAVGFRPDGGLFASGDDRTIKLWNGEDGLLRGTLEAPKELVSVALSNNMLVAAGDSAVTLWSLDTLSLIHTFYNQDAPTVLAIAENNSLIAIAHSRGISFLDAMNHRTITTFHGIDGIHTMTFLPDNLHLLAQSKDGAFISFNLINKYVMKGATPRHLIQLPNIPLWHGVPVWYCWDIEHQYLAALFPQHMPVLWIPKYVRVTAWTQGSSMTALGCRDGRVILLRLPTSHVG